MSELTVGQVIAGKYRVDRILGQGGMGYVVLAHHIQFEDRVALKLLLPELSKNAEVVERFVREGRAARKIRGDHVVEVSDVGQTEDGVPFMVMEYLDGQDLQHELKARGPLPVDEAIDFVLQACEALVEAHAMGIVHRDLKPANLFLTRRRDGSPCIKVLDFGISKMKSGDDRTSALTRTTGMMGTVLYMSPEQLQSAKDVDARSDIWAVGCILYELLTGAMPFLGEDIPQTCVQIMMAPTPSARTARPDVPAGVDAAIARALEKAREARVGSIAELAASLAPFAAPRSRISVERIAGVAAAHGDDLARASGVPGGVPRAAPAAAPSPGTSSNAAKSFVENETAAMAPPRLSTTAGASAARDALAETSVPKSKTPMFAIAGVVALLAIAGGGLALRGSVGGDTLKAGAAEEHAPKKKTEASVDESRDTRASATAPVPAAAVSAADSASTVAATSSAPPAKAPTAPASMKAAGNVPTAKASATRAPSAYDE